jgi:hypothetical protein
MRRWWLTAALVFTGCDDAPAEPKPIFPSAGSSGAGRASQPQGRAPERWAECGRIESPLQLRGPTEAGVPAPAFSPDGQLMAEVTLEFSEHEGPACLHKAAWAFNRAATR